MMRAMHAVNESHAARGFPCFEMGIGINTGEAVVGNIGSEQRAKYAVVGNAVNTAARVEAATVGGQILISAATRDAIRDLAEVAGPTPVQVKGLSEPLLLWDLRALRGRYAQRLPEAAPDERRVEVALPVRWWTLDGKVVGRESVDGTVVRLGRRVLDLRADPSLTPRANVRLRLTYTDLGRESGDLYGKVVGVEEYQGQRLARVHLTSIDADDEKAIEAYLRR
jgi:adenylate cyclase